MNSCASSPIERCAGPALAAALEQAVEDFHARGMALSNRSRRDTGKSVVSNGRDANQRLRVARLLDPGPPLRQGGR